ncbi:uncharacterized protein SCHCODRAFT_02634170 [Schizophyllum commune H4-8]|uniref:uncharacterized protein n=1 Tax=Schizophyllum commune (strain H4-8 / FGSC 9210) TaxID=578458 RepID=UPI00215DFF88|nr:uncharacterized protein SCHCODRAFT_02634170 [Schizophyllum commune H4-8]KAI5889321.1 hypothetical protein SCHCODRAFT_02634170 [Schizophyllum commune H4-8]
MAVGAVFCLLHHSLWHPKSIRAPRPTVPTTLRRSRAARDTREVLQYEEVSLPPLPPLLCHFPHAFQSPMTSNLTPHDSLRCHDSARPRCAILMPAKRGMRAISSG